MCGSPLCLEQFIPIREIVAGLVARSPLGRFTVPDTHMEIPVHGLTRQLDDYFIQCTVVGFETFFARHGR